MDKRQTKKQTKKMSKALKIFLVVLADIALIGVSLITFALFHHVIPDKTVSEPIIIERPTNTPAPATNTPDPNSDATPGPTEAVPLTWAEKFADKFTDGEIIQTDNSFISENTHITVTKVETTVERVIDGKTKSFDLVYYVTDVYITDIEQFVTAFSEGEFVRNTSGSTLLTIRRNNGIVGINGDFYGNREDFIIRNGALYDQDFFEIDMMVLYYDGTMEPVFYNDIDINQMISKGAYQSWAFGPVLVKDGQKVVSSYYPDYIQGDNPRTAIGYYEPGHYCFVVVDGRSGSGSLGADINLLSDIFIGLGCESAYNLDGGGTAALVFDDEYQNYRESGRGCSDVILITDPNYVKEGE